MPPHFGGQTIGQAHAIPGRGGSVNWVFVAVAPVSVGWGWSAGCVQLVSVGRLAPQPSVGGCYALLRPRLCHPAVDMAIMLLSHR